MKLRTSWVWLLVLFTIGGLVESFFYGQLNAFTPLYLPRLGIPPAQVGYYVGMIASITGLVGLPFLPFWGALADRYARKPVIIRSFVVHLAAGVVALLAGNITIFTLGRSISSMSLGNSGLMLTTLSEKAPSNRRGLAFSIMSSASPIGAFLGPLLGGPILDRLGFRTLLTIDTVLLMVVILSLSLGYKDDFKGTDRGPILKMALDSVFIILRSRRLRSLFLALFMLFAGWMMAQIYVPLAVAELYPGPDKGTMVGLVIGAGGFISLVLGPTLGAVADRFGYWRLLFIAAIIEVILWPLPALVHGLFAFGASWAVISGLGSSVFAISFTVLAGAATSDVRGRVMSFAYLPVNMGMFIGPAIGSLVTRGSVFTVFPIAAVFTALGVILLVLAYRQQMA